MDMKSRTPFRFEESALFLILSNLFTIVVAVYERWDVSDVMWVYWGQSVVIGFFNVLRMLSLRQFSTDGVLDDGGPVPPTKATQRSMARFFTIHYGLFHFVYFWFLCAGRSGFSRMDIVGIVLCIAVFAVNHAFSFRHNLEKDLSRKPNIGTIMFFPYARIIPMHLTLIFGGVFIKGSTGVLILFLVLKTGADLIMHMIEHAGGDQQPRPQVNAQP